MLSQWLGYFVSMDEELRNRFRRTDYTRRAQSATGHVRPVAKPRPKPTLPSAAPVEKVSPPPVIPVQEPEPTPIKQPKLPKPPKPPKQRRPKRKKRIIIFIIIMTVILVLAGLAAAGWFLVRPRYVQSKNNQSTAASTPTIPGISFPLYYPSNLPVGYTYNKDIKVIKEDVLYYSITDPAGNIYHVTLQKLPAAFNFSAFNSKFQKPDLYTTNVGSVVAGQVGASSIASIQTSNNVWILINTDAKNVIPQLETISRSFQQATK